MIEYFLKFGFGQLWRELVTLRMKQGNSKNVTKPSFTQLSLRYLLFLELFRIAGVFWGVWHFGKKCKMADIRWDTRYRFPSVVGANRMLSRNYLCTPATIHPHESLVRHRPALSNRLPRRERYTRSLSNPCLTLSNCRSSTAPLTTATAKSTLSSRWWRKETTPICTPDQLLDIIREPVGYYALPSDPYNEVYPGIYLSDAPTALCTALLRRIGVTHVLNAAQGKERASGQVNTWPGFYSHSGIHFHGVEAFDNIVFRLYLYFEEAAQFIDEALNSGGKALVHCRAGISRSATLVCAFLMLKRNMTAQEAVKTVRKHRAIIPNDGFLQQLCDLNDRLTTQRQNISFP